MATHFRYDIYVLVPWLIFSEPNLVELPVPKKEFCTRVIRFCYPKSILCSKITHQINRLRYLHIFYGVSKDTTQSYIFSLATTGSTETLVLLTLFLSNKKVFSFSNPWATNQRRFREQGAPPPPCCCSHYCPHPLRAASAVGRAPRWPARGGSGFGAGVRAARRMTCWTETIVADSGAYPRHL